MILIVNNINLNVNQCCRCSSTRTGVQAVCTRGDSKALSVLLEFQTSLPSLEAGLLVAAKNGHGSCLIKILQLLQESYRRQETLTEALHAACKAGRISTIKILLDHGADPYKRSQDMIKIRCPLPLVLIVIHSSFFYFFFPFIDHELQKLIPRIIVGPQHRSPSQLHLPSRGPRFCS